jgi:hypothetical protein
MTPEVLNHALFSAWDRRRIVFTKKIIAFSNVNDDAVLDLIPLHEVTCIRENSQINEMMADDSSDINGVNTMNDDNSSVSNKNLFEIETNPTGYNSGRVYQIKAKSVKDCRTMVDDLTKLSANARDDAEAKSKFKKSQERFGKIYNSNTVQQFLATLIFAVNKRCRASS